MEAGRTLGPWVLVEKSGTTPWTETWRAKHGQEEKHAIVEVVTDADVAKELASTPFRAVPVHPGIARTIAAEPTHDPPWFASEPPEGESLRAILGREKLLPSRKALPIATQLLEMLAQVHERGVYHGRLSPESIVVGPDGTPRVLGFGPGPAIDRVRRGRESASAETSPYLAPEQTRRERVDERVDLHALGIMLHEMVAGQTTRPETTVPGVVPNVGAAIVRATNPDPALRVPSALDLRAQLLGETKVSRTARHTRPAPGDEPSGWPVLLAAIAIAAVVVGGLVVRARNRKEANRPAPPPAANTPLPIPTVTGHRSVDAGRHPLPRRFRRTARLPAHGGHVQSLSASTSGDLVVSGGKDGQVKLWSLREEPRLLVTALDLKSAVLAVAISPDGTFLAASTADNALHAWSITEKTTLGHLKIASPVVGLGITPDGHVVAGAKSGAISIFKLAGRKLDRVADASTPAELLSLAIVPNGGPVLAGSADGKARAFLLPSGSASTQQAHGSPVTALAPGQEGRLATGGNDGSVKLWSGTGALEGKLALGGPAAFVALGSAESPFVAAAPRNGALVIATHPDGVVVEQLAGSPIHAGLTLDDRTVITGDADGAIAIWRADIALRWTVFDDGSGSSKGNGDGLVQPGETIELECELTKYAVDDPGPVKVQLIAGAPGLIVRGGETVLDSWTAQKSLGRVAVLVAPTYNDRTAPLELSVSTNTEALMSEPMVLKVESPR